MNIYILLRNGVPQCAFPRKAAAIEEAARASREDESAQHTVAEIPLYGYEDVLYDEFQTRRGLPVGRA